MDLGGFCVGTLGNGWCSHQAAPPWPPPGLQNRGSSGTGANSQAAPLLRSNHVTRKRPSDIHPRPDLPQAAAAAAVTLPNRAGASEFPSRPSNRISPSPTLSTAVASASLSTSFRAGAGTPPTRGLGATTGLSNTPARALLPSSLPPRTLLRALSRSGLFCFC